MRPSTMTALTAVGLLALAGCRTCRHTEISARPPCDGYGPTTTRLVPVPAPPGGPRQATYFEPAPNGTRPPQRSGSARLPTREPPLSVPGRPDPKTDDEPDAQSAIDLPGFAIARPGVATGIQPFPDGITWLKNRGYRTVLHLSGPGEDTAAARRQFEAKGLKYTNLVVSPARLNEETYKAFVKAVEDKEAQPLFVYDKDGSNAGGMWFLYNRVGLNNSDEKSRAEAQRLGLRPDDDGEHGTMWLAVQALLKKLKP